MQTHPRLPHRFLTRGAMNPSELVFYLSHLPEGSRRTHLLDLYHSLNVDRFEPTKADWYRKEYEWLRAHPMAPVSSHREPSP